MEPRDMAPVQKRLTISVAETTSSRGTGGTSSRNSRMPRRETERDLVGLGLKLGLGLGLG